MRSGIVEIRGAAICKVADQCGNVLGDAKAREALMLVAAKLPAVSF